MSAYSREDLEAAFLCVAEESAIVPPTLTVEATREKLLGHLDGNCSCDRSRCAGCGARPRNTITIHKPKCPKGFK